MRTWNDLYKMLKNGEMDQSLIQTGCEDINAYRTRATEVMNGFEKTFGVKEDTLAALCSAPGRTEICGNHTDHQHGHVLAAAVNSCMCVTEWDSDRSLPVRGLADDDGRFVRSKAAGSGKRDNGISGAGSNGRACESRIYNRRI